jgi:hypothetical protein
LEGGKVNTVAVVHSDLDDRIAAAFADGAKSSDVVALIKHTERAAKSAADAAEQARKRALDPTLSANDVADARRKMEDAAFKRDRLQAALGKLGERLKQLQDEEENARRQVIYDKLKAERDQLAKEYTDLYPPLAQKLAELLSLVAANDREVDYLNKHALPKGADRLLEVELIARELPGWVQAGIQTLRVIDLLRLPPWRPRTNYLWPPGMK